MSTINQYEIIALNNGVVSNTTQNAAASTQDAGVSLDTYGDIDISLNYQIDDILDITKRNTNWSKTISLPGTAKNNRFFKSIFDVNIDVIYFNPAQRIPAVIRVGANEVLKGYMQLMNVTIDNKEINYEISIAGTLKDIISSIEDYNLDVLDLSEYNHTRNQDTIVKSWDYEIYKNNVLTNVQNLGEGYVYPYIINGNSTATWTDAYVYDLYPAVYTKTVIDKIFDFAGFTYTSKFFNSDYFKKLILPYNGDKIQFTDEDKDGRTAIIGYTATGFDEAPATDLLFNGSDWYYNSADSWFMPAMDRESGTVSDASGDITFQDDGDLYTINGNDRDHKFTITETGYYDIDAELDFVAEYFRQDGNDIGWNNGQLEWRWELLLFKTNGQTIVLDSSVDSTDPNDIWGTILFTPSDTLKHPTPWRDFGTPLQLRGSAEGVYLEQGDIIRVKYGHRHPQTVNWDGSDSQMASRLMLRRSKGDEFSILKVEPSSNNSLGNENINMNQILDSSVNMKDMFLDIVKMFNLIIQDNPNKIGDLIVEPRDDFFASRQKILNWDEEKKLDNDSTVKLTPMSELDAESYLFTYEDDDDFYNKEYKSETQRVYGDREVRVKNDFSNKVNKLEIGFSPTPNAQRAINARVAPFFVESDGEGFKPKKVNRRILFYGGRLDIIGDSTLIIKDFPEQDDSDGTESSTYPYCGMWDNPIDPTYDLGFGRTEKLYWNTNVYPNNNLYEQFHKQTINNIIDLNAKLMECKVYLTPKDIAEFDFRNLIFLNGSYWRVNKIKDYNPVQTDRLTTVILYKVIDVDVSAQGQVSIPTSNVSCPVDMVSKKERTKTGIRFITVSQSGQEVTADCCNSLGGKFVDGVCVLGNFEPGGGFEPAEPAKPNIINVGGLNKAPINQKDGPEVLKRFNTSRNNKDVTTIGSGHYLPGDGKSGFVMGKNNTIAKNLENTFIVGDGISANQSGTFYLGNIKIDQSGNILSHGNVIIDGGEDEVFPFNKTNFIDIIDGTIDDVRNPGGDSKGRPIIDGNIPGPE